VLDHVSIQVADPAASKRFYETVLAPIGGKAIMSFGPVTGFGKDFPNFWIGPVGDAGGPHRDAHIAFTAGSRAEVDAFFATATSLGAEVLHEPREWPEYHATYYGAFVRDPDGNNVEAVHHGFDR
jgi:catechol 2,3-dioxygenase-like lactoylglutathione lyase family enzyme